MPNRKTSCLRLYAIFALVYVLCAVYGMSYFFQNSALGDMYPGGATRFDAMVDGYAAKPFIYRQLVPILIRAVDRATPQEMRLAADDWMENIKYNNRYQPMRDYMPWLFKTFPLKITHYKRLVASIIILGFLLGYMAGIFALARSLFPASPAAAFFAPVFAVLAFSSFGYQWQYVYDIPCLCLSTACFYALYERRFRLYMFMFFLACLNKETAVFNILFFSLWFWNRMSDRQFALLWGLQCAIYLVVKSAVSISYMNNHGFFLEQNVGLVLTRDVLSQTNLYMIIIFAAMWLLFTHHWQDKPEFLKTSLWLLPLMYAAYFFFGYPREYRVFFDLHAPLVLLATHTLVIATGLAKAPSFAALECTRKEPHVAD